jgi:hypothetical protein
MSQELRELLDREQIRELAIRHAIASDALDYDGLVELFDPELENDRYGKGREGVRAYYSAMFAPRAPGTWLHGVSNHQIDFLDDSHAVGVLYVRAFTGDDTQSTDIAAMYLDEYVKRDERWYFSERVPYHLTMVPHDRPLTPGTTPVLAAWERYSQRLAELRR